MPFNPNTDYSSQLDEMLAPYQRMSQQSQNPYATMSQNSWLARNHPRMAGVLDNAFLTTGMTPEAREPEGVGGGISRTFQGLMGARQFRHQQSLEASMLPLQMLEPRLKMEDMLAQRDQRSAQAQYEQQHGQYLDKRTEQMDQQLDINQQKATAYEQHINDLQNRYERDPIGAITGKGGTLERLAVMQTPRIEGESDPGYATRVAESYTNLYSKTQGTVASARKTGEEAAPHTYEDARTLLNNEHSAMQQSLPKILSEVQWEQAHLADPDYYNEKGGYEKYRQEQQAIIDKKQDDFSVYLQSGAYKKGIRFKKFQENPNATQWDSNTTPSTSSNSAPNPNYTRSRTP